MIQLNILGHPVLAVDREGRLVHANPSGERELALAQGLHLHAQHVRAANALDHSKLLEAIEQALRGQTSLIRLRIQAATQHAELFVLVTPLLGHETLATLQLECKQLCDTKVLALVAQNYQLTNKEHRVLTLLCESQEAPDIATTLGVAVSTIRSHILAIRTKTAVNSIRQLVDRIARLPSVGAV